MSPGLRIIAGEWRGRKLVTPTGQATRPTASRARETLFSMLTSRLGGFTGLSIADLYAGSGALGIEALSRGAAHCIFVDSDRAAIAAITRNLATLAAADRATTHAMPASSAPAPRQPVDLALFDPPYAETGIESLLESMAAKSWFAPAAWISIETGHDQSPAPAPAGFTVEATREVGKARLTLLRAPA
jgi:16S rRNA (guanine966-N2)-methyltransferase